MDKSLNRVEVAVGLIQNRSNEYLLALRQSGTDHGGYWEFPGGKIEPGETPLHALQREFLEEINITVLDAHCVLVLPFDYPGKSVRLHCFDIKAYDGTPVGAEGQRIAWFPEAKLKDIPFLEGSRVLFDKIASRRSNHA